MISHFKQVVMRFPLTSLRFLAGAFMGSMRGSRIAFDIGSDGSNPTDQHGMQDAKGHRLMQLIGTRCNVYPSWHARLHRIWGSALLEVVSSLRMSKGMRKGYKTMLPVTRTRLVIV